MVVVPLHQFVTTEYEVGEFLEKKECNELIYSLSLKRGPGLHWLEMFQQ